MSKMQRLRAPHDVERRLLDPDVALLALEVDVLDDCLHKVCLVVRRMQLADVHPKMFLTMRTVFSRGNLVVDVGRLVDDFSAKMPATKMKDAKCHCVVV